MALGFIIPSSARTLEDPINGVIVASDTTIRPDKSFSNVFKPRVHLATFGDGYEQRLVDGINSIPQEFTLQFNKRTKEEVDNIIAFLESLKGATSFNFTIPDTNSSGDERTLRVVCDNFQQSYDYGDFYSCSAKFRRVYEA
jgi:phage-related protein